MEVSTIYQLSQIVAEIALAILFVVMIKSDVKVLKVQMEGVKDTLKVMASSFGQLSDVLSKSAVHDNRLSRAEADIRELQHGHGFVDLDGEYTRHGKVPR